MNQITGLTSDPYQQHTIALPSGLTFVFNLYYIPQQYGWFITNLTYNDFILNSVRVTVSPNMLFQFQNLVPFGLACISPSQREPSQLLDFSSGASEIFLLTQAEVIQYNEYIRGGALPS